MTLAHQLREYVRACFTGLWIQSHEHEDALLEIAQLCREEQWRWAVWDIERGLNVQGTESGDQAAADPLAAIQALPALAGPEGTALLVLVNFHRFLQSAEVVQAVARQINQGKQQRTFLVVLSPVVNIPVELEKQIVVLEHALPNRQQLEELARSIACEPGDLPTPGDFQRVLDASSGLTRFEAEGAFSLSLVRRSQLEPETLWEIKAQTLKKSGLLTLHRGQETFAGLGGLESLKAFCLRAMRKQGTSQPHLRPRGVLLLSPPGCGKSQFARALGHETQRPTLILDIGALMNSLVGETERNVRQALRMVDAMAPCILFCDEIEKHLSGVSQSGRTDSGVSARMFGSLLTWLSDRTSDVFFIATANNIAALPPELSRAERLDAVYYLDLPGAAQREQIWQIYLELFGLDKAQARPDDSLWTGAEIRAACRLAALLDVPLTAAAQNVVPVAHTSAESVQQLRQWASGRCLSADQPGIYTYYDAPQKATRRVSRGAAQN